MAGARRGAERIVLPRRFPSSALGRIVGYLIVSGIVAAALWLLFGEEPKRLPSEMINPMAYLPQLAVVIAIIGLVPIVTALFRRPLIKADNYALTVRSGIVRTLVLPWARISDIAVYDVSLQDDPEQLLLIRCVERHGRLGDTPGWWDQSVLRAAAKAAGGAIGGYDLAVKFADFHGDYREHLAAIEGFAPERVTVADRTASAKSSPPKPPRKPPPSVPRAAVGSASVRSVAPRYRPDSPHRPGAAQSSGPVAQDQPTMMLPPEPRPVSPAPPREPEPVRPQEAEWGLAPRESRRQRAHPGESRPQQPAAPEPGQPDPLESWTQGLRTPTDDPDPWAPQPPSEMTQRLASQQPSASEMTQKLTPEAPSELTQQLPPRGRGWPTEPPARHDTAYQGPGRHDPGRPGAAHYGPPGRHPAGPADPGQSWEQEPATQFMPPGEPVDHGSPPWPPHDASQWPPQGGSWPAQEAPHRADQDVPPWPPQQEPPPGWR